MYKKITLSLFLVASFLLASCLPEETVPAPVVISPSNNLGAAKWGTMTFEESAP